MAIGQPNGGRMRANIHTIKSALRGRWESVLARHAPALHPALQRRGQHVPCPIHGGRDGFRVFRDVAETGGGVCNTCGVFHDGIALLAWVNDWSISQVVDCLQDELRSSSTVAFTRPISRKHHVGQALTQRIFIAFGSKVKPFTVMPPHHFSVTGNTVD